MPFVMDNPNVEIDISYETGDAKISGPCLNGVNHSVTVNEKKLRSWLYRDALVQDAFPHLTPNEREYLMTGTCCSSFWDEDDF
jgi:hypothetical protein